MWLTSLRSPSGWSVVVATAADVAVMDGIGVRFGIGHEGLVETGLEDGGNRAIAGRTDDDATAAGGLEADRTIGAGEREDAEARRKPCSGCGLARMIACDSAAVEGPIFLAASSMRSGVQKAYRRCALGMCSGMVVCVA